MNSSYIKSAIFHPIQYTKYLYYKYIIGRNKGIYAWSIWELDDKTKKEILLNGFADKFFY